VFAIRRGEIGKRFDVRYNLPHAEKHDTHNQVKLGSLCLREPDYGLSATAITRTNRTQPKYIRITDFSDHGIEDNHVFTTVADYSPKHILNDGDILFARSGSIGRTYRYDGKLGLAVFAGYCIRFIINPEKALPEYVYWYTKTKQYENWVQRIKRPTVQPNINKEEYKSLEIILPSRDEQIRLVSSITVASQQRIAKLREADEQLTGMDSYVLERLGIGEIPIKSRIASAVNLRTLKDENTIGAEYYHPGRLAVIRAIENDPAVSTLRLSDIVDFLRDAVSADGKKYLGLAGVVSNTGELSGVDEKAEGQAFSYSQGDVLYARLRPYLNKVLFAETDGVCSTEFHVMRVNCADVQPEYLAAIMRSKIIVAQTKHMMTGNTHPRISNEDVRNLRIPIPSMSIQSIIIDEMRKRSERSRQLKHEVDIEWLAAKEKFERELIGGTNK
jgi:restriction endonuclease S subunit